MIEILSFQLFVTPSLLPTYRMKDEGARIFFLTMSLIEMFNFFTCTF